MNGIGGVRQQFMLLVQRGPRQLWVVFALKMLESLAYFAGSLNLTLYLTAGLAYDDVTAGMLYSGWGTAAGVASIVCGPIVDRLGVHGSLIAGGIFGTLGRLCFMMATPTWREPALLGLLVLQPIGMGLGIPVLAICIRRMFSPDECGGERIAELRPLAYGMFYSVMNVAALLGGLMTDAFMSPAAADGQARTPAEDAIRLRRLFAVGVAISSLYCLVAGWLVDETIGGGNGNAEMAGPLPKREASRQPPHRFGFMALPWFKRRDTRLPKSPLRMQSDVGGGAENIVVFREYDWRDILYDAMLWRLAAISVISLGARAIFMFVDTLLPIYLRRTLGAGARYGLVYSINPAFIIVCVPPLQAWIARRNVDLYWCIVAGAVCTTLAPLAFLFGGASYTSATVFMLFLSIGEAIGSPVMNEFFMRLAPAGREGVYGALASLPIFAVKLLAGGAAGSLLAWYCPASGSVAHCGQAWVSVAAMSAVTPFLLTLFSSCLHPGAQQQQMSRHVQL